MSTHHRPRHTSRELARSLTAAADDLASWVTGRRRDRNGINGLVGWITGHRRKGNSVEQLASWITGRKPRWRRLPQWPASRRFWRALSRTRWPAAASRLETLE